MTLARVLELMVVLFSVVVVESLHIIYQSCMNRKCYKWMSFQNNHVLKLHT